MEETQTTTTNSGYAHFNDFPLFDSMPDSPTPREITSEGFHLIRERVLLPIMEMDDMQIFRPAIDQALEKIREGSIQCLRDLEKALLFELGHVRGKSHSSPHGCLLTLSQQQSEGCTPGLYLRLCDDFLLSSKRLWPQLYRTDLCRPGDQPYDSNYFLDVWRKVLGTTQMRFKISSEEVFELWEATQARTVESTG